MPPKTRLSDSKQRQASIVLMLAWCGGLLAYLGYLMSQSAQNRGDKSPQGMAWNLFLALLPLLWGRAFQSAEARKRPVSAGVYFLLWLLFLPNAPYLITDLLHLRQIPNVPLWYLLATLMSCAGAGTILGYLSLIRVQAVIGQKWGETTGWAVAVVSLLLCGFGIYLGRFLYWNSWDALVHPVSLMRAIRERLIDPGPLPSPLAVTLVLGVGLVIGYLVLRAVSTPCPPPPNMPQA